MEIADLERGQGIEKWEEKAKDSAMVSSIKGASFRNIGLNSATDAAVMARKVTGHAPGGIDLNPNQLNMKTQGEKIELNIPADPAKFQNFKIDGAYPVIINIQPITNLPMLLGVAQEKKDDHLSLAR